MALKKYLFFLVLVTFFGIHCQIQGTNHTADHNGFTGGSGTEDDPWQVATPEQLNLVRQYLGISHVDKHFLQISDIDLGQYPWNDGQGWEPIGTSVNAFYGTYDGNGHVISDLTINLPSSNNVGLWGFTGETAFIYNLGLHNANVNGGNYIVGTLVGFNKGLLSAVHATGSVSGGYRVGGLAGENNPGTIADSFAQVDVVANDGRIGGLVGFNVNGTVSGSYATGDVTAGWYVGGLVGRNLNGHISESYATGNIIGSNSVGGLLGDTEGGSVANSYATGSVTGGGAVGGLIGYLWQTQVNNTYSSGTVTGTGWGVGGLIGYRFGGQINNSYWNTETTGQDTSDGGTGKTTTEMAISETFINWDFANAWNIYEEISYPFLTWQGEADSHNYPFRYTLILAVSPAEAGNPQKNPDLDSYEVETEIWLEAGTNEGYQFLYWTNQHNEEISDEAQFIYHMPPEDILLTASFLAIQATYILSFHIVDNHGNPLENAVITLNNVEHPPGVYIFEDIEPGLYSYEIRSEGYFVQNGETEITDHDKDIHIVMNPDDTAIFNKESVSWRIYPNPASDILYVDINHGVTGPIEISLSHINGGKQVWRKTIYGSEPQHLKIPLSEYTAGTYLLLLQTPFTDFSKKVMVIPFE